MRKVMKRAKSGESKMRRNWLTGLVALTLLGVVGCAADQEKSTVSNPMRSRNHSEW